MLVGRRGPAWRAATTHRPPHAHPHHLCGLDVRTPGRTPAAGVGGPPRPPPPPFSCNLSHPSHFIAHLGPRRLVPPHAPDIVLKPFALTQAVLGQLGLILDLLLRRLELGVLELARLQHDLFGRDLRGGVGGRGAWGWSGVGVRCSTGRARRGVWCGTGGSRTRGGGRRSAEISRTGAAAAEVGANACEASTAVQLSLSLSLSRHLLPAGPRAPCYGPGWLAAGGRRGWRRGRQCPWRRRTADGGDEKIKARAERGAMDASVACVWGEETLMVCGCVP